jgi:hypothetical protein
VSRGPTRAASTSRLLRVLQLVGTALTLSGVFLSLKSVPTSLPWSARSRDLAAAALSLSFLLAAAAAPDCQLRLPGGLAAAWRTALGRAPAVGLSLAPLVLLPLCHGEKLLEAAVVGAALIAYATGAGRSTLRARRLGRGRPFGPWEVALLGFCIFIAIVYVQIGLRAKGNFQNDSAYYFGVAKHIALTGRFEEPIVWHFLRVPPRVPTAPFDYWGGLTSVVLVPFLWLFGATHQVANTVMACISALSVLVFWDLVAVRRVVKSPPLGAALLVAFALAPSLSTFRFDTESVAPYQLLTLLILVAAARKKWALCSVLAALVYYTRPSGALLALIIWVWALYESRRQGALKRVAATQLVLVALTLCYGLVLFGTPLGVTRQAARMKSELDLYLWNGRPSIDLLHARLGSTYLLGRITQVVRTLLDIVPGGAALLALAAVAGITPWIAERRLRSRQSTVIWVLGVALAFALGLASGSVFVPWRTLHPLIPLVMLAGGQSLDALLDWLWRLDVRRLWRGAAATLLLLITGSMLLRPVKLYGDRELAVLRTAEVALQKLDPVLQGGTVASNIPWYVIANTRSAAVSIPRDGPVAIAAVLGKYHVEWLAIIGRYSVRGRSAPVIYRLLERGRGRIGRFRLTRDRRAGGLSLFSVKR